MMMGGNKMKSLQIFSPSLLLIVVLSHSTFQAQSLPTEAFAAAAISLGENRTTAVERTRGGASPGGGGSGGHGSTGGGMDNGGGSGSGSGYGSGLPNLGVVPADDSRNGGNRNHRKSAAVGWSCSFPLVVFITFSSAATLMGVSSSV